MSLAGNAVRYRWTNVVRDFAMPVRVTIPGRGTVTWRATTAWQSDTDGATTLDGFAVDQNWYVTAKVVPAGR